MGGRVWGPSSWGRLMGGLGAGEGPLPARSVPSRSARGAPGSTQEAEPSSRLSRPRAPARAHPPAPQPGAESPWPPKRETNERVRWGEQGSEATDTWQLGEKALLLFRGSLVSSSATLWTAACQASLSFTISWSLLKLLSIEPVMASDHLILCHSLLLLPSAFPSIRVFSNELALRIWWPKDL